jgi:hypothetical protein
MSSSLYPADWDPDDAGFNYDGSNLSGGDIDIFNSGGSELGLYNFFTEMKYDNNNLQAINAFCQNLLNEGAAAQSDPIINALMTQLNSDGGGISNMMANMFVASAFLNAYKTGGTIDQIKTNAMSYIMNFEKAAQGNPLLAPFVSELQYYSDPSGKDGWSTHGWNLVKQIYLNGNENGPIGYKDKDGNWVSCVDTDPTTGSKVTVDAALFDSYLSGQIGNWINNSKISADLHPMLMGMFDKIANNPTYNQYGAFAILCFLMSMLGINSDNSNTAGLTACNNVTKDWNNQISDINSMAKASNFTQDSTGYAHSQSFFQEIQRFQAEVNNYSDGDGMDANIAESVNNIMNFTLPTGPEPAGGGAQPSETLEQLYESAMGDQSGGTLQDLTFVLQEIFADPSAACAGFINPDPSGKGPEPVPKPSGDAGCGSQDDTIIHETQNFATKVDAISNAKSEMGKAIASDEQTAENTLGQVISNAIKANDAVIKAMAQAG